MSKQSPIVDLQKTYLYAEGSDLVRVEAAPLWKRLMEGTPAGPEVERVALGSGWLIGMFPYVETWTSWEMHPGADETVHVIAGLLEFVLDEDGTQRRAQVGAGQTLVVPRGAWHRAIVHAPGSALHVTFGQGTEHRPLELEAQLRFRIMRQDDNGQKFVVQSVATRAEAEAIVDEYTRRGHKQMYWCQEET